jgi:hypothetical protein
MPNVRRDSWIPELVDALLPLASVGLLFGGIGVTFAGCANLADAQEAYGVAFTRDEPGDDCNDLGLVFDVDDGERLLCSRFPGTTTRPGIPRTFEGFSDEQIDSVVALAGDLGTDGLSSDDQHRIRERIDQIVSTIPRAERPYPDGGRGAALQAWIGVAMLAVAAILFVVWRVWIRW